MEKERRIKVLAIVVLVIAVLGLTVAFAALSQTLTINGIAKLDASKWGLKFDNLVLASGGDYIEGTANIKTEDNTVIENMNVRLTTPGDKVVYIVDLVNEGSINAKIDKIEKTALTTEQEKYLSFKVFKENNEELNEGYVLGKETSIPLRIEIEFIKDITKEDLPKEAITITLSYGVTFVQTDNELIPTTTKVFKVYDIGEEFCLDTECFYTISDNGNTITALAKYNISTTTYKQSANADKVTFSNTNYWVDENNNLKEKYGASYPAFILDENSNLWYPLQNYKSYLINTFGIANVEITILTLQQMTNYGCPSNRFGECYSAPSWVVSTNFWLGTAISEGSMRGIYNKGIYGPVYYESNAYGIRPVITISKTNL